MHANDDDSLVAKLALTNALLLAEPPALHSAASVLLCLSYGDDSGVIFDGPLNRTSFIRLSLANAVAWRRVVGVSVVNVLSLCVDSGW